ncbi:MAG TPA: inorganic diphosphatase [bacterium]|nr:inorganic diphosphatase [bacterium]HPV65738.1 inorganic diphosphatase [bacterium]
MKDYAIKFLNKIVQVKIDRPLGSKHPRHNIYYSLNYGYVPGVLAPDGEELDAYILGVFEPIEEFIGKCIAIVHRLDDDDDKLIVVPSEKNYTKEQIYSLIEFQERFFKSKIII